MASLHDGKHEDGSKHGDQVDKTRSIENINGNRRQSMVEMLEQNTCINLHQTNLGHQPCKVSSNEEAPSSHSATLQDTTMRVPIAATDVSDRVQKTQLKLPGKKKSKKSRKNRTTKLEVPRPLAACHQSLDVILQQPCTEPIRATSLFDTCNTLEHDIYEWSSAQHGDGHSLMGKPCPNMKSDIPQTAPVKDYSLHPGMRLLEVWGKLYLHAVSSNDGLLPLPFENDTKNGSNVQLLNTQPSKTNEEMQIGTTSKETTKKKARKQKKAKKSTNLIPQDSPGDGIGQEMSLNLQLQVKCGDQSLAGEQHQDKSKHQCEVNVTGHQTEICHQTSEKNVHSNGRIPHLSVTHERCLTGDGSDTKLPDLISSHSGAVKSETTAMASISQVNKASQKADETPHNQLKRPARKKPKKKAATSTEPRAKCDQQADAPTKQRQIKSGSDKSPQLSDTGPAYDEKNLQVKQLMVNQITNIPQVVPKNSYLIYSEIQLLQLFEKAFLYTKSNSDFLTSPFFYRDKSSDYYTYILTQNAGVMEKYTKDHHGDQKSPINGVLEGLFFSVNMDLKTGLPPRRSIYGDTRLNIPSSALLQQYHNLYFTDFYCISRSIHYVTLVMTRPGSDSDEFCRRHLVPLDWARNPFIRMYFVPDVDNHASQPVLYVTKSLWVEILYTESIRLQQYLLCGAYFERTNMTGKRSGGRTGLPKNSKCQICNL